MKVGDLVKIVVHPNYVDGGEYTGVIVRMISFERGKNPQPVVLVNGKCKLYGSQVCEVISENR